MKPRALDLFCCAGGASMGLHKAGFEVTGIDIRPQKNYPFTFIQADALNPPVDLRSFDFIWASPPCQHASRLRHLQAKDYPALIEPTREMLLKTGRPWVIENVMGAALKSPALLCGTMFGLGVWRHRQFECNGFSLFPMTCAHEKCPLPVDVTGTGGPSVKPRAGGGRSRKPKDLAHARAVMGIDWMDRKELSQAIPPAYAEHIGRAALAYIKQARAA